MPEMTVLKYGGYVNLVPFRTTISLDPESDLIWQHKTKGGTSGRKDQDSRRERTLIPVTSQLVLPSLAESWSRSTLGWLICYLR